MIRWFLILASLAVLAPCSAAAAEPVAVNPIVSCASLTKADLSKAVGAVVTITSAAETTDAKPFCKLTGTIAPQINFEVRLPLGGWTQRYLQTGCGGLCGGTRIRVEKATDCAPVTNGEIALASTNMGHEGMAMDWGSNPQQRADFAHRGVHVTALAAKALIARYYGKPPRFSYFSGCSDGGREALIEARRYPQDFDGIAAGAPALNFTVQNSFYHAWMALSNTGADGKPLLMPVDLEPLHRGALAACDALDGLADGQIDDPRACKFDPASMQCAGDYAAGECLTAVQVAAARRLYGGAVDAQGRKLVVGSVQPGSELSWVGVFVPRQPGEVIFGGRIALETINNLLFSPNPAKPYTLASWPFDAATLARLEAARKLYNADDANLAPFAARGGKLILWHGWSDPHISPLNTIDYYNRVGTALGAAKREAFVRMFLFPAMYHCSGGEGPSDFPLLNALMNWVEGGRAPAVLIASRSVPTMDGLPDGPRGTGAPPPARPSLRTRPVFAYPSVARYAGSGSIDDATNFKSFTPSTRNERYEWLGARK